MPIAYCYATKIFITLQLFDVTHQEEDGSSILKITCMYYAYIDDEVHSQHYVKINENTFFSCPLFHIYFSLE